MKGKEVGTHLRRVMSNLFVLYNELQSRLPSLPPLHLPTEGFLGIVRKVQQKRPLSKPE